MEPKEKNLYPNINNFKEYQGGYQVTEIYPQEEDYLKEYKNNDDSDENDEEVKIKKVEYFHSSEETFPKNHRANYLDENSSEENYQESEDDYYGSF